MDKFLFIFGGIIFVLCFVFFTMNLFTEYHDVTLVITAFGMLNASIAIGVAMLLNKANAFQGGK